ncbi:sphingosine-1-phosphate phosphatase 2-like isoform X2 [Scyliorhinus canicula]|uniref:sphingosine-1-phosphate phosphatase 2-like isoform X2 n=1 Tax=Scyliorhinus canicula TaxID=7830 RepID=UPI0018F77C55|nr:sphingosine-1-phosphate phosphatase 2-like isoform X2 [Scyliorhinus canicula]
MDELLNKLRGPELVAQFQRLCGLSLLPEDKAAPRRSPQADRQAEPVCTRRVHTTACRGDQTNGTVPGAPVPRKKYKIENYFLYYLFLFAATLGQEVFYITFLPFCYWNIDPYVARRVINIWAVVMYIGQASKDVLKWPRPPSPPVVKLEVRVDAEYGMPSTHAMAATAIPFSFLLASMNRYKDVLCGVAITVLLVAASYPFWDAVETFQMENRFAPVLALSLAFLLSIYYPELDHWSTARGDTTNIVSAGGGAALATWINHQWSLIPEPVSAPPYEMPSLSTGLIGRVCARFAIGIVIVFIARHLIKSVALTVVCWLAGVSPRDQEARKLLRVEVPYKYITYSCLGVVGLAGCPAVHRYLSL